MPTGAVKHDHRDGARCDRAADHGEMFIHRLDVDLRHDDRGTNPAFRTGGAEQKSPGEAMVFLRARTRSAPGPDASYGTVLADSGFVLEPDLERAVQRIFRRERGTKQGREVFLKAS